MSDSTRIDSLPADLRAIANDMLSEKFGRQRTGIEAFITTNHKSTGGVLTEKALMKMMNEMRNHWYDQMTYDAPMFVTIDKGATYDN